MEEILKIRILMQIASELRLLNRSHGFYFQSNQDLESSFDDLAEQFSDFSEKQT